MQSWHVEQGLKDTRTLTGSQSLDQISGVSRLSIPRSWACGRFNTRNINGQLIPTLTTAAYLAMETVIFRNDPMKGQVLFHRRSIAAEVFRLQRSIRIVALPHKLGTGETRGESSGKHKTSTP